MLLVPQSAVYDSSVAAKMVPLMEVVHVIGWVEVIVGVGEVIMDVVDRGVVEVMVYQCQMDGMKA